MQQRAAQAHGTAAPPGRPRAQHQQHRSAAAARPPSRRHRSVAARPPSGRHRSRCVAASAASAYSDPEPRTLFQGQSEHSPDIRVMEIPDTRAYPHQIRGGRVLYLDDSPNIHSVWHPDERSGGGGGGASSKADRVRATGAYFDVLATLPALLGTSPPTQPIVILGLGAGTCARLMDGAYPGWFSPSGAAASPLLIGVELDGAVVDVARAHMGLAPLLDSGALAVRVEDALADPPQEEVGACSGVVVDLFARGRLLPELKQPETWRRIVGRRLLLDSSGGGSSNSSRAIINLGAGPVPNMPITPPVADALEALAAMEEALGARAGGPGVCCAALRSRTTSNLVAMTGGVPTRQEVNAAAGLLDELGAPSELSAAAAQTLWMDAAAFAVVGGGGGGGRAGGPPSLPGGMGGRKAHYGGGPGMGGPAPGRMRF
jgi:hypothetical protein